MTILGGIICPNCAALECFDAPVFGVDKLWFRWAGPRNINLLGCQEVFSGFGLTAELRELEDVELVFGCGIVLAST